MPRFKSLYRNFGLIAVVIGALALLAAPTAAQTTDYFARYENIPKSRTADGGFVLGDPAAPVTVVEFADFICPHCQDYQETAHQFIETYVATGAAKFEYRFFPVVDPEYSPLTAAWATCAEEQKDGAFWPAHDALYDLARAGQIDDDSYEVLADIVGVDADKLTACAETSEQHEIDAALGQSVGVSGTPAVMIRLDDGTLGWAYVDGRLYNRGGVPLVALDAVMSAANLADVVLVPRSQLVGLIDVDPACEAPCWAGITPGKTTWEEGLALIEANRLNVEVQTAEDPDSSARIIQWRTADSQLEATNRLYSEDGETIAQISLIELSPYVAGELIEALGDPEYALGSLNDATQGVVNLFYPEQALVVTIFVRLSEAEGFSEASQVIGAYFFSPEGFAQILESTPLIDWAGYEGFESYLIE